MPVDRYINQSHPRIVSSAFNDSSGIALSYLSIDVSYKHADGGGDAARPITPNTRRLRSINWS